MSIAQQFDLIGGGGKTDFCPGGKHPRAATGYIAS